MPEQGLGHWRELLKNKWGKREDAIETPAPHTDTSFGPDGVHPVTLEKPLEATNSDQLQSAAAELPSTEASSTKPENADLVFTPEHAQKLAEVLIALYQRMDEISRHRQRRDQQLQLLLQVVESLKQTGDWLTQSWLAGSADYSPDAPLQLVKEIQDLAQNISQTEAELTLTMERVDYLEPADRAKLDHLGRKIDAQFEFMDKRIELLAQKVLTRPSRSEDSQPASLAQ